MARIDVIVIGAGALGSSIAKMLCGEGENVLIIDKDENTSSNLDEYSGFMEFGDALDLKILERNGISQAKCVVIATNDDDTNIFLTDVCRKIYGVKSIYVRLKDSRKRLLVDYVNVQCICPYELSMNDFSLKYYD